MNPLITMLSNSNHRDTSGRFTLGCKPGPGRPPKPSSRTHIQPGLLHLGIMEMEDSAQAWASIVDRLGPQGARAYLKDVEAENGPIRFRHVALAAIADGEARGVIPREVREQQEQLARIQAKKEKRLRQRRAQQQAQAAGIVNKIAKQKIHAGRKAR